MKRLVCMSGCLLLFAIAARPSHAVPLGPAFTYQGQLNQNGSPVSGTVHMRFSLWDGTGPGSNQVGSSQVVPNLAVTNGLFAVELNNFNQFGTTAFSGDARWLQIEVCADAGCASSTLLSPRQPLNATPYSLGPWRTVGSDLTYSNGRVGIGTTVPEVPLHIRGPEPVMVLQDLDAPSTQSGYLGFWNNSSVETGWVGYGTPGSPNFSIVNVRSGGDVRLFTASGAIKMGVNAGLQYCATGGEENLRIVRGTIDRNGTVLLGAGFTVSHPSASIYDITFTQAFAGTPTITANAHFSPVIIAGSGPNSLPTANGCRLITDNGFESEMYFTAVGPR